MELYGGPGFDVFGNDFTSSANGIHEETNSSAELNSHSSNDFMEGTDSTNEVKMKQKMAQTLRRCSSEDAQETSWQDRETQNEMSNVQNEISTTQNGRELNASVFLTGEQICSGEFNDIKEDFEASEGGIRAEASSCNVKGFDDVFRVVQRDGFQSVRNNEELHEGIHLSQEVAVDSNASRMKNSESCDSDKLERPDRRDVDANCVLVDCAKFVALLIENLLQFLKLSKEWASKTLAKAKAKAIPTLTEKGVEMNVIGEFAPECASIMDQQNGREKNYTEDLVRALGFPLGMSVATVLAETMKSNNCLKQSISADDMSELLGSAIRESLNKVLDSGCNRLVKDFELAFTSTFKTIKQVKQVQYQKKITSYPTEKKMPNSDGQTCGLATVGFADLKEHAIFLPNLQGKIQEKTDCCQVVEQTPSTLNSKQGIEMKCENQQSCKPSFIQSAVQVTAKSEDECPEENCRVHSEFTSCITETFSKDCNVSTCPNSFLVNQHDGGVAPSHREMGFANPEIEDIIQKLNNVKLDSAYSKNISIGYIPSVSSAILASTARCFEECDSNLASASHENGITSNMSASHHNPLDVFHGDSQRQLATKTVSSIVPHTEWPQSISQVFERSLIEQKRCNNLTELEIGISLKHLQLKEAKMSVAAKSNELQRQSISINQYKTSFKESKFIDQKLNSAYVELNRTCADHLVAGLVLMLFALAYGSWKYSYSHFSNDVEMCRAITKEQQQQKSSWFYNPMDSIATHFQTLSCRLMVIGRMLFGWAAIAFSATLVLRRTVASSSQAMPTTIILIVLGLVCGYAGKLSVDNVGGNGFRWLVHWEALCFLHALSACFPSFLLRILNGPASSYEQVQEKACLIPLGIRKFFFHMFLLVLPVMAGLAPFASLREWTKHFSFVISDNLVEPVRISVTDYFWQFMGV